MQKHCVIILQLLRSCLKAREKSSNNRVTLGVYRELFRRTKIDLPGRGDFHARGNV
jgi:hypothetical protein